MKISVEWLKDYVEIRETPEQLKDDLTMLGLVVESISPFQGEPVLEIEVTSNRPDCLSHVGVAREISALYKRPLKYPPCAEPLAVPVERIPYEIRIKDRDLCPRYTGLVMDGVRIEASPAWLQHRLEAAGMRPLNNIVDITNYVLLELGHPLHAFDFQRLRKGKIVVARARPGQRIITLDGVERELDEDTLLINDGDGPVAIAGVMGGLDSEIKPDTRTILLECAYFNPPSIRRTAKKLGLSTEASYRFERGADWGDTIQAAARTCLLIQQVAGGEIAGSLKDVYPAKIKPVRIGLRRRKAEALLGVTLEDAFVTSTLERLNFKPAPKGKGKWQVTCPSYRADTELEADVIEEIARFYGYQNVPNTLPRYNSQGLASPVFPFENAARRILLGLGYCEAVNLSFAAENEHNQFAPGNGERVALRNPLTEDTQFLRTTLAPGLVKSARRNFNHGIGEVRLFEIGRVYSLDSQGRPLERNTLGIVGSGGFAGCNWRHSQTAYDFFHLKGAVVALLRGMRSEEAEVVPAAGVRWLNPGDAAALIVGGERAGVLGSLHPDLAEEYKLKQPVFLAEIDFEALCRKVFQPVKYEPLPKYPAAERDLSVVLPREVSYGEIRRGILGLGVSQLVSVELLDVYEGESIPAGKVSMTFRFVFLDRRKTLTVDQVQAFSDNILTFLRSSYNAELR